MQKVTSGAAKPNTRSWRSLRAALAYLMTRDEAFAEEVERDEGANQNIELDLQIRRAMGQETSEGPSTAHDALLLLRSYISDGMVKARGIAVDRRGNGLSFRDTTHPPAPLPPHEAEHLVLCDGAGDETGLRCEEAPFGQGRYWRCVTVHWPDLRKAMGNRSAGHKGRSAPQTAKIEEAVKAACAAGTRFENLTPGERVKILAETMKEQGCIGIPSEKTFRTYFKRYLNAGPDKAGKCR